MGARAHHCLVEINDQVTMLVGGIRGHGANESIGTNLAEAWIDSWPDEAWIPLPNMPTARHDMACALFTDGQGVKHVLVAGVLHMAIII